MGCCLRKIICLTGYQPVGDEGVWKTHSSAPYRLLIYTSWTCSLGQVHDIFATFINDIYHQHEKEK